MFAKTKPTRTPTDRLATTVNPLLEGIAVSEIPKSNAEFSGYLMSVLTEARALVHSSHEWPVVATRGRNPNIKTTNDKSSPSSSHTSTSPSISVRRKPFDPKSDKRKNTMFQRTFHVPKSSGITYEDLRSVFWDYGVTLPKWFPDALDSVKLQEWHEHVQCWWMSFASPSPLFSRRCFCGILVREEITNRHGGREMTITVLDMRHPNETTRQKGFVRGSMIWIESLIESPDGTIQHVGIQRTDAGGIIPRTLVDFSVVKAYAKDIKYILRHLGKGELWNQYFSRKTPTTSLQETETTDEVTEAENKEGRAG